MLIVKIQNDGSGKFNKNKVQVQANYNWNVFVNERCIASGRLENYTREAGWEKLLWKIAVQAIEEKKQQRKIAYEVINSFDADIAQR